MLSFSDFDTTIVSTVPGAIEMAIAREQVERAERRLQAGRCELQRNRQERQQADAERERIAEIVRDVMANELPEALETLGVL